MSDTSRRDLLRLSGGALWVRLASACGAGARKATPSEPPDTGLGSRATPAAPQTSATTGFLMFQITDTHWGYKGPDNPAPTAAFEHSITEIARWPTRPELVVHTGDVTHMTSDAGERKARLEAAKKLLGKLGTELLVPPASTMRPPIAARRSRRCSARPTRRASYAAFT